MQTHKSLHTAGWLLAVGAAGGLIAQIYWLTQSSPFITAYRAITFLFGRWLGVLIAPGTTQGYDTGFRMLDFAWIPWSATVLALILFIGMRAIQARVSRPLATMTGVFGLWTLVGEITSLYINGGLWFLKYDLPTVEITVQFVSIFASLAIIAGSIILFRKYFQSTPERRDIVANGIQINPRFRTLTGLGKFISIVGWIVVIIGAILFLAGLSQLGENLGLPRGMSFIGFASGLGVALYGLLMVASGQAISCFVSMENNTFETMQTHRKLLSQVRTQTALLEQPQTEAPSGTTGETDKKKSAHAQKSEEKKT